MAVYQAGIKGLFTESNPQDTPPETMQDCQDVVISRDNLAESRHGINATALSLSNTTWNIAPFEFSNASHTIFEAKFDEPVSGHDRKLVILNGQESIMDELSIPTGGSLHSPLNQAISGFNGSYTPKPIGFTFDQSLYIVTTQGWMEMKKDILDSGASGVKKLIQWPPFVDINIDTFQDTLDFSANWFDINKKVGIRLTYVQNTRYNDEPPREIESEPSQIFEVLHPMALRTQASGSTVANTIKDKSRIRVRVGEGFTQSILPFANYTTSASNNRRFYLRVYRTKQVDISEALPTEFFQAFPDIEIGASTRYAFANDALVSSASDTIDFGATEAPRWQNGALFKYRASSNLIGGLTQDSFYYLGNKTGTTFQVYTSGLLTNPVNLTAPIGNTAQYLIRVYEANLTVNDDGIITLPQLYSNPNLDGAVNTNTIPPIAESVVEYKNYHVAANIREPLRAYISLVNQPLVKHIETNDSINVSTTPITLTQLTAATSLGYNVTGITANNFKADGQFWYDNYPTVTNVASNILTFGTPTTTTFSATGTFTGTLPGMVTLFQSNAQISFRLDGGTVITAPVLPKYNRQGLYARTDDTNLEYLQFAGRVVDTGVQFKEYNRISKLISVGTQRGQTPPDATVTTDNTVTISGNDITLGVASSNIDSAAFQEPGIIAIGQTSSTSIFPAYYSYKTVTSDSSTNFILSDVSPIGPSQSFPIPAAGQDAYVYFIEGSSLFSAPLYHVAEPTYPVQVRFDSPTGFDGGTPQSSLFSYRKLTGYYDQPVAVSPDTNNRNITLLGPLAKSPAQLIDDCVFELVKELNEQAVGTNEEGLIKFVKTDNVGEFYVEYYSGTTIEARIAGDYHSYEPEIIRSSTEWTTLAEYKKNNLRAVSVSRYNAPESFPNATVLAPFLVGSDKAKIVALAKNSNDCFILKEDGIWRLSITGNSSLPLIDEITQLDTTTFCQAPYSVQEINEEVIFLSQKGFISINGNQIDAIGRPIETEVKEKLQRAIANGLQGQIRSWVNEEKRIYGCTIPETTVSYTTYVLNTYTREWTKFALPVVDAFTDSKGRTTYLNKIPYATLGSGATLQEQLENASTEIPEYTYITQEQHTDGQFRSEDDQYDFKYIPQSVALGTGNQVILTDRAVGALDNRAKLGGTNALLLDRALNFFIDRPAYYVKNNVVYPCTFVSRTATTCTIEFADGVPADITTISGDDGLYAGVPASITFNPSNLGAPNTNKVFSEYQLHTVEAVSSLSMQFITDSRSTYSTPRVFAFNRDATSRTVYRSYIPLEMMRGRWIIRKVTHDVPLERLQAASQSLTVRDTGSSRVQKAPR